MDITPDTQRIAVVGFFDSKLSLPQGDPAAGNRPRVDPNTGRGLMTRFGVNRDLRDQFLSRYSKDIFCMAGTTLEDAKRVILDVAEAAEEAADSADTKADKKKGKTKEDRASEAEIAKGFQRAFLEKYADSMFGFVGQANKSFKIPNINGWVNVSMALSVEPIDVLDIGCGRTTSEKDKEGKENRDLHTVSYARYGVYKFMVIFDIRRARSLGLSEDRITDDVEMVKDCLLNLFQERSSYSKVIIGVRRADAYQCKGKSAAVLNAAEIFDMVQCKRRAETLGNPAENFSDYEVLLPEDEELPPTILHETWKEDRLSKMRYRAAA